MREVLIGRGDGLQRAGLRPCTPRDRAELVTSWVPVLERGPTSWLDRQWSWAHLASEQLAFPVSPDWLVIADDLEPDGLRDLLGTLVTTGPVNPALARLDAAVVGIQDLIWVEYVAIAPSIRPNCPVTDRRPVHVKGVGPQLMRAAIERSFGLGCDGRVGLHAEGDIAVATYERRWKMQRLPDAEHPAGGHFPVFFGSNEWAKAFVEERSARP